MPLDRQLRVLVKDRVDRSLVGKTGQAKRAIMFLSMLLTFGSLAWWAMAGGATRGRIYNPGHVSLAHARFENDCAKCHAGDGGGGFSKQVTDQACLACHDGAIHHPNQKIADSVAGVSRDAHMLAVMDTNRPAMSQSRSADCVSCHVEHRGQDLMLGRADEHCIVCHGDLPKATQSGKTALAHSVTAFADKHHPTFGGRLLGVDPQSNATRLIDPTQLKFNHRKHLTEVPELAGDQSCITCHTLPANSDGRYTTPVRYEQNCKSCHGLTVPDSQATLNEESVTPVISGLVAPHARVADVRAFLAAQLLAEGDKADTDFAIEDEDHKGTKRQLWLYANAKMYAENAGVTFDESTDPATLRLGTLADAMTANLVKTSCAKCHTLTAELPASLAEPLTVETTPTGMAGNGPRRWFARSRFDHRAHRNMSCVECHSDFSRANLSQHASGTPAPDVEQTSFLHSPNMTWTEFRAGADGKTTSSARSCVECHHADTLSAGRGAAASCVTCHDFHDRTRERGPAR